MTSTSLVGHPLGCIRPSEHPWIHMDSWSKIPEKFMAHMAMVHESIISHVPQRGRLGEPPENPQEALPSLCVGRPSLKDRIGLIILVVQVVPAGPLVVPGGPRWSRTRTRCSSMTSGRHARFPGFHHVIKMGNHHGHEQPKKATTSLLNDSCLEASIFSKKCQYGLC